jgi:hypothetical protein
MASKPKMPAMPAPPPPPVSSTGVERQAAEDETRRRSKARYSFEDTVLSPNTGLKRTLG